MTTYDDMTLRSFCLCSVQRAQSVRKPWLEDRGYDSTNIAYPPITTSSRLRQITAKAEESDNAVVSNSRGSVGLACSSLSVLDAKESIPAGHHHVPVRLEPQQFNSSHFFSSARIWIVICVVKYASFHVWFPLPQATLEYNVLGVVPPQQSIPSSLVM